jgi:mannose-6-phosphate isomerase-like protein (cupin superfamily)
MLNMPSRRTMLKAAAVASTPSVLMSQEPPSPAPARRAGKGFNIAPGKSRRGEPLLLRGKDPTTVKVSGTDTGGQLAIFETTTSPGDGPGLHKHAHQDEWWYVLEGEFVFQVGEEKFRANAGTSVFGPRGIPHSFLSVGAIPGKMIITFQPAGRMEAFFEDFAKTTTAKPDAPVDGSQYGIEGVGPRVTADAVK